MTTQPTEGQTLDVAREVGLNIRTMMFRNRVTGQQLAAALGIGGSTVSQKLHGKVAITVTELMTIAGALGVDAGELLPRLDSNQEPSGYSLSLVSPVVDLGVWRERRAS